MAKIYRAGLIPYIVEDDEVKMLFMKPSIPKFGGDVFQIAKGKVEDGESTEQTALREANEELGLFAGNVVNIEPIGRWLGRSDFFITEVKDVNMFGEPGDETGEVKWLTLNEFFKIGRDLHKPIVKAAHRKIRNLMPSRMNDLIKESIPLNEVLDYRPKEITWEKEKNIEYGYFDVEGNQYRVFFEYGSINNFNYVNIGFEAMVNDEPVMKLQNWKASPYKVLGGVLKGIDEKFDDIIKNYDIVVFGVAGKHGEPEKRMRMYSFIVKRYAKSFGSYNQHVNGKNGKLQVLYNTERINEKQQEEILTLIQTVSLK